MVHNSDCTEYRLSGGKEWVNCCGELERALARAVAEQQKLMSACDE